MFVIIVFSYSLFSDVCAIYMSLFFPFYYYCYYLFVYASVLISYSTIISALNATDQRQY